jgi:hypothetical protein
LLDQQVDQGTAVGRNVGTAGNATARAARVRIDAGEPGDEATAQESEMGLSVAGNVRVGISRL